MATPHRNTWDCVWYISTMEFRYSLQIENDDCAVIYNITRRDDSNEDFLSVVFLDPKREVMRFKPDASLVKLVQEANDWADAHDDEPREEDEKAIERIVVSKLSSHPSIQNAVDRYLKERDSK